MMIFQRLAKDSAIYGGADLITKLLWFFAFPIIATVLPPKAFGALELMLTVTALLGLFVNCGLNNAVQRYYWDINTTEAQKPMIVTSGLAALVMFGLSSIFFGFLLIPFIMPWMRAVEWPATWIAPVAAILVMVLSQWAQYILDVIRLYSEPWNYFLLALISRVLTIVVGLIAVVILGLGIDGLLAAQTVVMLLVMPLALWLIRRDINISKIDLSCLKELVEFGHPFILTGLAYWLFGSMDRWMLASMTSVDEVGIYSIAFRFASVALFVSTAFGQAWSPVAIKIRTDHPGTYREIYGHVLLLLVFTMLIVAGALALFSGEVISLIMPVEYNSSALPFSILCFGIILQATQQVTAIGISLEKKTYIFTRMAWIAAAVNFIGNLLLIPNYGAAGSAWATLISYVVLTVGYMLFTQRLHPLEVQWEGLAAIIFIGIIVAFVSINMIVNRFNWNIFFAKLIFALLCAFIGWRTLPIRSLKAL